MAIYDDDLRYAKLLTSGDAEVRKRFLADCADTLGWHAIKLCGKRCARADCPPRAVRLRRGKPFPIDQLPDCDGFPEAYAFLCEYLIGKLARYRGDGPLAGYTARVLSSRHIETDYLRDTGKLTRIRVPDEIAALGPAAAQAYRLAAQGYTQQEIEARTRLSASEVAGIAESLRPPAPASDPNEDVQEIADIWLPAPDATFEACVHHCLHDALAAEPVFNLTIAHLLMDLEIPARRIAELLNMMVGRTEWTERRVYSLVDRTLLSAARRMWFIDLGLMDPDPKRTPDLQIRTMRAVLRDRSIADVLSDSSRTQAGMNYIGNGAPAANPITARLVRWYLQGAKPAEYEEIRRELGYHVPGRADVAAAAALREAVALLTGTADASVGLMALASLAREAVAPKQRPEGGFVTVDLTGTADRFLGSRGGDGNTFPGDADYYRYGMDVPGGWDATFPLDGVPFLHSPVSAYMGTMQRSTFFVPVDMAGAGYGHLVLHGSYCKKIWRDARMGTIVVQYTQGPPEAVPLWLGYNLRSDRSDPNCVHELTSPWAREIARTPDGAGTESTQDLLTVPLDPRRRVIGIQVVSHAVARTGDVWPFILLHGLTFEAGKR